MRGLDKRLRAVVDGIECKTLADIGCDHGKVAVTALIEGRAEKAIACDISQKSLDKAISLAKSLNIQNIEFRAGDGLEPIADGEVDCVVIAGMGAREIISILGKTPKGIEKFILVAHKNTRSLRAFLAEKGLEIHSDFVVEQGGKFYDIIVALAGGKTCPLSEKELYLGKNTLENADFTRYIDMLKTKRERFAGLQGKSQEAEDLEKIFGLLDNNG